MCINILYRSKFFKLNLERGGGGTHMYARTPEAGGSEASLVYKASSCKVRIYRETLPPKQKQINKMIALKSNKLLITIC